jgi:hypothetical protein
MRTISTTDVVAPNGIEPAAATASCRGDQAADVLGERAVSRRRGARYEIIPVQRPSAGN